MRRLTDDAANDQDPSWSPDGRQIAYKSNQDSTTTRTWVMNADGSHPHALALTGTGYSRPAWTRR